MRKKWWLIIIPVFLAVIALSPLVSTSPDGLERVAQDNAFSNRAQGAPFQIMVNYIFPGIDNPVLAKMLAGLIGTLVLFGVVYGLAWLLKSRRGTVN